MDCKTLLHAQLVRSPRYNSHMNHNEIARRRFLAGAALTAASYSRLQGANDTIQLGVIGVGDRGSYVTTRSQQDTKVHVAAVCDIYSQNIDRARQKATDAKSFTDHRKLLEEKGLDAVLIATPDHWHATIAIDALNSGHDVYVEKPLTLRIAEGPRTVKAARVNERVCQVGMQQRSGKHYIEAKREHIDKGRLGKITLAPTWWHGNSY